MNSICSLTDAGDYLGGSVLNIVSQFHRGTVIQLIANYTGSTTMAKTVDKKEQAKGLYA